MLSPLEPEDAVTDADALRFEVAYAGLRRFAAAISDRTVDPDDLVHDALVRALRRGRLDEIDDLASFLRRTIVNLEIDRRRSRDRQRRADPLLASPAVTEPVYPSDVSPLDEFDPLDRAVLLLVDVENYSFAEAADLLGVSAGSLRMRAVRARRRLRQLIERGEEV